MVARSARGAAVARRLTGDRPPAGRSVPALTQFDDLDEVRAHLAAGGTLSRCALQGLDLRDLTETLLTVEVSGAVFMGCTVATEALGRLHAERVLFFPPFDGLPFRAFRGALYSPDELFAAYE